MRVCDSLPDAPQYSRRINNHEILHCRILLVSGSPPRLEAGSFIGDFWLGCALQLVRGNR